MRVGTQTQDSGSQARDRAGGPAALPGSAPSSSPELALLSATVAGPVARAAGAMASDWWLPGPARLVVSTGTVTVQIRKRQFAPLPRLAVIGATDRAHRLVVEGGSVTSAAISPFGWSRLSRRAASTFRNLVVPVEEALRAPVVAHLIHELGRQGDPVSGDHDALLALTAPHRDEELVLRLAELLRDPVSVAVRELHDALGISEARLRSLALRHFGAPAKILLRRARFLRSLALVDYRAGYNSYAGIEPSYHDVSHFLRDAHYFLGTTPRRFRLLSSRH